MRRIYQDLGLPPEASNLTVLRTAIRRLHPDTLAIRSWRAARKRYYRELLQAHAEARAMAAGGSVCTEAAGCSRAIPNLNPAARPGPPHAKEPIVADYFTHFSCVLDVGSPEKASAALDLLTRLHLEEEDESDPAFTGFALYLQDGPGSSVLWFHDEDGQGDASGVIRFVLCLAEEIDLTGLWGFEVAFSCSRPRLDAFGGAAHVIDLGTRKIVGQVSTNEWLAAALSGSDLGAVEALVQ